MPCLGLPCLPIISRGQEEGTRIKNKADLKVTCELMKKGEIQARIVGQS